MKVKTSELTRAALNWVVASIEWPNDSGILNPELVDKESVNDEYAFHNDAKLLVTIIEREKIRSTHEDSGSGYWLCFMRGTSQTAENFVTAVLRCHVANKLGDEVEVPDHLL